MPAAAYPIFYPADVDFRVGRADKIYCHFIARIGGADHQIHLAPMRHHRLEAETQSACETAVALDVGDRLGLLRTHWLRKIECRRDLVRIDIFAEIDARFDEMIG